MRDNLTLLLALSASVMTAYLTYKVITAEIRAQAYQSMYERDRERSHYQHSKQPNSTSLNGIAR